MGSCELGDTNGSAFARTGSSVAGSRSNGDAAANNKDVVRLKNYLANLDEETGLSTYTLGPAAS